MSGTLTYIGDEAMTFVLYATVERVHDADTLEVEVDQGLGVYQRTIGLRFASVDAAELGTPDGDAALAEIDALVSVGDQLRFTARSFDKFARRIDASDVVVLGSGTDLIAAGLSAGWLRPWSGHGPKPWPQPTPKEG